MNVRGMPGRHGPVAGEVGADLVNAGMLYHAAPATCAALPAEFEPHISLQSGALVATGPDMTDAAFAPAFGGIAGWQGQERRTSADPAAPWQAWNGAAPWGLAPQDDATFAAAGDTPAWESWSPPAGPDPLDPRSVQPALLGLLDRLGLSAALLQPAPGSDWRGVMDAAARAPERLRAVLPLASLTLPPTLAVMARHGLAGLSVMVEACRVEPALWRSVLLRLAAHGLHLHLKADPDQWPALLPFVLGHGTPVRLDLPGARLPDDAHAALERHAGHPDLWIGFVPAAVRAHRTGRLLERLVAAAGPSRLLWHSGAGEGGFDLDDHLLALLDLFPTADIRQQVAGANARWLAFGVESFGDLA
ncbi:hypothetical protein GCM10007301_37390 [Azorhizobium oxalatiphilum]|uniref:Uncharacterized protein n=1 Tax=Azorhizobium oxalatiphilum TaxID=980631 RepID=A0A917FFC2_9HYPH|nr:hypothetical protein [Azorhizobium oxalatiphilum]GGF74097.1 hypothetical protein GCM10007301_37390 [Azorhizobium oxalatiphilum]